MSLTKSTGLMAGGGNFVSCPEAALARRQKPQFNMNRKIATVLIEAGEPRLIATLYTIHLSGSRQVRNLVGADEGKGALAPMRPCRVAFTDCPRPRDRKTVPHRWR